MKRFVQRATTLALCALTIGCAGTIRYSENAQGERVKTTTTLSSGFVWGVAAGAAAGALAYHILTHEDAPQEDAIDQFIRHNYSQARPSNLPRKQSITVPTQEHRTALNALYERYYGLQGQQKAIYMLEDQMHLQIRYNRLQRQAPRMVVDTVFVNRPSQPRSIPFSEHIRPTLNRQPNGVLFFQRNRRTYTFPDATLVCYERPELECVRIPHAP